MNRKVIDCDFDFKKLFLKGNGKQIKGPHQIHSNSHTLGLHPHMLKQRKSVMQFIQIQTLNPVLVLGFIRPLKISLLLTA